MGCSDGKGKSDHVSWRAPAGVGRGAGQRHLWAGRAGKEPGDFWRVRGDDLADADASGLVPSLCRHLAFLQH